MAPIRNSSRLVILAIVVLLMAVGCKSKKQAMQASNAAREKARLEQEAALRKQKEAELKQKEDEERARRERESLMIEPVKIEPKEGSPSASLNSYFDAITHAGSVSSANSSIQEALGMFASPEAPVLIVISDEDGQKDYDRPTTIQRYLNYLKDQKKNINTINNLKFDAAGKITELELRKIL